VKRRGSLLDAGRSGSHTNFVKRKGGTNVGKSNLAHKMIRHWKRGPLGKEKASAAAKNNNGGRSEAPDLLKGSGKVQKRTWRRKSNDHTKQFLANQPWNERGLA